MYYDREGKNMGSETTLLMDEKPQRIHEDLRLLDRAIRERWPVSQERLTAITERVEKIALDNPDAELCLKAVARLQKMIDQNRQLDPDQPARKVEHHHTHEIELGPVTAENLEQHKARALARISGSGRDA